MTHLPPALPSGKFRGCWWALCSIFYLSLPRPSSFFLPLSHSFSLPLFHSASISLFSPLLPIVSPFLLLSPFPLTTCSSPHPLSLPLCFSIPPLSFFVSPPLSLPPPSASPNTISPLFPPSHPPLPPSSPSSPVPLQAS
ncbi:hypothetical protein FKM82_016073 [Ascaphus truei]